jgi:hypothetical protein
VRLNQCVGLNTRLASAYVHSGLVNHAEPIVGIGDPNEREAASGRDALILSVFPPPKGVRLVGVTLSNFQSQSGGEAAELPFREV